jgi:hypothetical protein
MVFSVDLSISYSTGPLVVAQPGPLGTGYEDDPVTVATGLIMVTLFRYDHPADRMLRCSHFANVM